MATQADMRRVGLFINDCFAAYCAFRGGGARYHNRGLRKEAALQHAQADTGSAVVVGGVFAFVGWFLSGEFSSSSWRGLAQFVRVLFTFKIHSRSMLDYGKTKEKRSH